MVVFWRLGFPRLERTFRRVGLNHLEYGFLAVLAEQPEGAMPEAARDVERRTDTHDRRSVIVAVTDQGRTKVDDVHQQHLADVRQLVFDQLTPEQTGALAEAMVAITTNLTAHPFLHGTNDG